MAMQKPEPGMDAGEPGQYPERPGQRDCGYYMRTGVCSFRRTCHFNHPPQRQLVPRKGKYPERLGQPDCQKYVRTGTCKFGATCKYRHPRQKAGSTGRVHLNADGLPMRQGEKECAYYMRTGSCKYGDTCKFHHPEPATVGENTCQISEANSAGKKVMDQSEPVDLSNVSECHKARDTHSQDTGPSCSLDPSTSSLENPSAVDVVQSSNCSRMESNSKVEREIEASKVHWSELRPNNDSDGNGETNREIYESLLLLPHYRKWLTRFNEPGQFLLGQKIAEGGQAEIFELKRRDKGMVDFSYFVLKVFKKGYSLRDLEFQWSDGLRFNGFYNWLFYGGMVLEDDRFALLLAKCDIDLRKLIDFGRDKNPLLFDCYSRSGPEELRTYEPQCASCKCPEPVLDDESAKEIMHHIAQEMKELHDANILHRDLKASNILCATLRCIPIDPMTIHVIVADYECSIGVIGTGFWRAPEILKQLKERKQKIHFTREADVYSYAMICYEICSGHIPFEGYKTDDYDHVLNGARPTLPDHAPTWVKDLIQRCWHQNPSERPPFHAVVREIKSHGFP